MVTVDGTASAVLRAVVTRRAVLMTLGLATAAPLLAACGGAAPGSVTRSATEQLRQPPTFATSTSGAVSPQAQASSSAATRAEPSGKVTIGWHTTIVPAWFDPLEYPAYITPYNFAYAVHDALVKHLPGKPLAPSLAESYEIASDFKSATFKLRPGIKFHDGSAVTPEDVKFTFENYKGANAAVLHEKTDKIDLPDDHTVHFQFKEPFLDFQILYGSPASGAAWVVPKAYYQKVGPSAFKQKPIGAGPYRLVRQQAGTEVELEAFTDYWRMTPNVKTVIIKGVPEDATRVAMLQMGEADFIYYVPGELLDTVRRDPKLQLAPVKAANWWMEFPGFEKPESPFHDPRVRQAVSLALDRKAINEAEVGGLGLYEGNWIQEDWPGAISRPGPPYDLAKAKQLMAEAGLANGFDVEQLTPLPPYSSLGERVVSQLRAINIRTKVNTMERGTFFQSLAPGPNRLKGIIMNVSGAPGDAASRVRNLATCKGILSGTCLAEIDDRMKQYDASTNPAERKRLLDEVQAYILDNYVFVPVYRSAFINAQGPRIANRWQDIIGAIPQYVYVGPFEEVRLKA